MPAAVDQPVVQPADEIGRLGAAVTDEDAS